jgi:hypothetical protein
MPGSKCLGGSLSYRSRCTSSITDWVEGSGYLCWGMSQRFSTFREAGLGLSLISSDDSTKIWISSGHLMRGA